LNISRQRLDELARAGRIPRQRIGRSWIYARSDLDAFKQAPRRKGGRSRKAEPADVQTWFEKMLATYRALSEEERQALEEWERTHLDGRSAGTSDWPGWEKYIGKRPEPS